MLLAHGTDADNTSTSGSNRAFYLLVFPEMKTALRTYHPVPALQRTNGNLQDAPRIKNMLKTCFLPDEAQGMVTTPNDVLARFVSMTSLPCLVT